MRARFSNSALAPQSAATITPTHATFPSMATAKPLHFDTVLDALARAPIGEEDMTSDQQAEFAEIVAEYRSGHARLIAHDEVPAALEAIGRSRGA